MNRHEDQLLDTLALYKLLLASGIGPDISQDLSGFFHLLHEVKRLSGSSIWLHDPTDQSSLSLLFAYPHNSTNTYREKFDKNLTSTIDTKGYSQYIPSDRSPVSLGNRQKPEETVIYFSLGNIGYLKICIREGSGPYSKDEIEQLLPIFKNFGQSLESSISLQRYKNELNEKTHYATKLRSMIDAALDAFIIINAVGEITEWNNMAEDIFGWSKDEVLRKKLKDIIVPHNCCDAHKIVIQSLLEPEKNGAINQRIEIVSKKRSGEVFPIELSIVSSYTSIGYVYYVYIRDITLAKNEEKKQAQLMGKLEEANHELNDFAHVVSHDLKAPLRAIKNLSTCITADYEEKLGEEGQELFDLLTHRVDRMKDLINGILEYSQMGRLDSEEKHVNISTLLGELSETLDLPSHIILTIGKEMPTLLINEVSITQVFQNLISNAIKYMDKDVGIIELGWREEKEEICFWVKDNGPGIAVKNQQKIFRIFENLGKSRTFESTGVGLAIVKKIISNYQGRVWLNSQVGEGASFFFSLPKSRWVLPQESLKS